MLTTEKFSLHDRLLKTYVLMYSTIICYSDTEKYILHL